MPNLAKARDLYNAACWKCSDAFYAAYGGSVAWCFKAVLGAFHIPHSIKQSEAELTVEEGKIPQALNSPANEGAGALKKRIALMETQLKDAISSVNGIKSAKKQAMLDLLTEAQDLNNNAKRECP